MYNTSWPGDMNIPFHNLACICVSPFKICIDKASSVCMCVFGSVEYVSSRLDLGNHFRSTLAGFGKSLTGSKYKVLDESPCNNCFLYAFFLGGECLCCADLHNVCMHHLAVVGDGVLVISQYFLCWLLSSGWMTNGRTICYHSLGSSLEMMSDFWHAPAKCGS